jgi:hypothetical protein
MVLAAVVASSVVMVAGPLSLAGAAGLGLASAALASAALAGTLLAGGVPERGGDERRADRACRGDLPGQPGDPAQARIPGRDR